MKRLKEEDDEDHDRRHRGQADKQFKEEKKSRRRGEASGRREEKPGEKRKGEEKVKKEEKKRRKEDRTKFQEREFHAERHYKEGWQRKPEKEKVKFTGSDDFHFKADFDYKFNH